ncbi:CBS domain-containing protein [Caldibacillus lycopersici]|uniref:CBS domain-containing protein n=1 Tax=Perspicuibacillus lycopersici TaxID=1325689 RepID=A0AAE3IT58_9BACI|nr:cyclic-di-AMP-binding protein CbpB [Perspicuibacillus lycopersici]MCU9612269.1 CBS domain-containing protein [Perspicuibacillus lycopersici]
MIDLQAGNFLQSSVGNFIIPSERVAHVQIGNNLEHALLVLTKTGYTAIPVLDAKYQLHGLISSPLILDNIMGMERIEFENLSKLCVEDVMNQEIPTLHANDPLVDGLKLLINHPFVCTVDENKYFKGILTRRVVLKQLNAYIQPMYYKEKD